MFLVSAPRANFFEFVVSIILYEYVVYGFSYASSWLVPLPRLLALIAALTGGIGTTRDGANIIYWGPYFTEFVSEFSITYFQGLFTFPTLFQIP